MTLDVLLMLLRRWAFVTDNEDQLQAQIAATMTEFDVAFEREFVLPGKAGRIDFLFGTLGLEIKVDGSFPAVAAQVQRYAECECISAVVLLTTKPAHRNLPQEIAGKPVRVVLMQRGFA